MIWPHFAWCGDGCAQCGALDIAGSTDFPVQARDMLSRVDNAWPPRALRIMIYVKIFGGEYA